MSDTSNALEQLSQMIVERLRPAAQQAAPSMGLGLAPGPLGFGLSQPMPASVPQPTGVSVPLVVPLPDGREVHVRVHFPAEAAANLPQLLAYCAQVYGQHLVARTPYRGYGGGYGNHYYGRGRRGER